MIRIEDIAAHLSKIARFTGATGVPFYVGEHSVDVSRRIRRMGGTVPQQFAGLMHDAQESYCSDASSPMKWAMREVVRVQFGVGESPYDVIEEGIAAAIAKKFGIVWDAETRSLVKKADDDAYLAERDQYFHHGAMLAMASQSVERQFLQVFDELTLGQGTNARL